MPEEEENSKYHVKHNLVRVVFFPIGKQAAMRLKNGQHIGEGLGTRTRTGILPCGQWEAPEDS